MALIHDPVLGRPTDVDLLDEAERRITAARDGVRIARNLGPAERAHVAASVIQLLDKAKSLLLA